MIKYIYGWVVGLDYHDGFEWLMHKYDYGLGLCRQQGTSKETDPHLFKNEQAAFQAASKILERYESMGKVFIREYLYETNDQKDLPRLGNRRIVKIHLTPDKTA